MNLSGASSESSSKRQENGDITTETERPLKKARFAWQVKGKYHLRNEINEESSSSTVTSGSENAGTSSESDNPHNLAGSTEQNLEILGDYLLKQDFNTLDSVIADSEKSILKPCRDIVPETIQYSKYDITGNNVPHNNISHSKQITRYSSTVPMSMVDEVPSITEEQCIARWQARQLAKGFVDNTINRVLDSWMVAALPIDMENRLLALDVADFINNLPGANSIENEGILMAISAHGLQNTSSSSSSSMDNHLERIDESCNIPTLNNNVFPSPPSSPVLTDDDTSEITQNCKKNCKLSANYSNMDSQHSCSSEMKTEISKISYKDNNSSVTFPYITETSSEMSNALQEEQKADNFYQYSDGDENASGNDDLFTDACIFDFMDAAVSFAIQNKGLTSYGTD